MLKGGEEVFKNLRMILINRLYKNDEECEDITLNILKYSYLSLPFLVIVCIPLAAINAPIYIGLILVFFVVLIGFIYGSLLFFYDKKYNKSLRQIIPKEYMSSKTWRNRIQSLLNGVLSHRENSGCERKKTSTLWYECEHIIELLFKGNNNTPTKETEIIWVAENALLWSNRMSQGKLLNRLSFLLSLNTEEKRSIFKYQVDDDIELFVKPLEDFHNYMLKVQNDEKFRTEELKKIGFETKLDKFTSNLQEHFNQSLKENKYTSGFDAGVDKAVDTLLGKEKEVNFNTVMDEIKSKLNHSANDELKHLINTSVVTERWTQDKINKDIFKNLKATDIDASKIKGMMLHTDNLQEDKSKKYKMKVIDRRDYDGDPSFITPSVVSFEELVKDGFEVSENEKYFNVTYTHGENAKDVSYLFKGHVLYIGYENNYEMFDLSGIAGGRAGNSFRPPTKWLTKELGYNPIIFAETTERRDKINLQLWVPEGSDYPSKAIEFTSSIFRKDNIDS